MAKVNCFNNKEKEVMKWLSFFGLTISLTILCTCSLEVFAQSRQTTQGLHDNNYPTNTQAQSTRRIPFQICGESQSWVRPSETEQIARTKSPRYGGHGVNSRFWTDNIFLLTFYGAAALNDPIFMSGLWTLIKDAAWADRIECHKPAAIQKINSGQLAEVWLLQHRSIRIEWQGNRYIIVVTPVERGVQFIQFPRVERQSPLILTVVAENGTELATLSAPDSPVTTTARLPNVRQATGERSPSPNQQTATRTIQPVIQTFSSVKSLGMAQFLRGTTELKSAQETLQKAARGEYDTITNGQKTDFIEDILEDIPEIRPVDCKSFGFSCESTEITYADYLNLKLKVYLQVGVFKNGMKVYDEIPKYQNRLFQDQRYGGLNVGQNLTSEWDKRWNNVKEQQRLKDEQANLPITERLGVVMEQTIQDTANFSGELFKTSTKVAATLAQIKDLAETITSLTSINQYNLNRIAGGPKYTIEAVKILQDSGKALQSFDTDKLNELTLKAAQETIELINAQDRKVAGSANVIKIYLAAKDIIDKNNLLRQPQATNALDDFDKFYIAATMYSKAVEVIIGGLSIPFSEAKVVDTLLKKADAVNTVLLDALEFTYKDSVRRQYVRLQYAYNRNQIQVVGLSSFIDYAAEEVGQYLLKARPDIVTRRPDGTIAVSVDGVVYPP